jgi:hypothetical protein
MKKLNFNDTTAGDLESTEGFIPFILRSEESAYEFRQHMRKISDYWPKITLECVDGLTSIGTWVRIKRDDKWWKVFVLQSAYMDWGVDAINFLNRFCNEVHKVQHLYKLTYGKVVDMRGNPLEELDPLQIDEVDRLIKRERGRLQWGREEQ